jgi:putative acetyltransferase
VCKHAPTDLRRQPRVRTIEFVQRAWYSSEEELVVGATLAALCERVAGADDHGVVWWIPNGHQPTVEEAVGRLAFLRKHGISPYAFPPTDPQPRLSIERVWLDDTDVQVLISNLNSDLYSRYPEPGALVFSLESADIQDGVGLLLMAVLDDEPVGCGAFRVIDDRPGSVEIKRLYVTLAGRGKKIGSALLTELERRAVGIDRFALEFGPRQPEAQTMFESAGYVVCEPWGPFVGKDFSICMEKVLSLGGS